MTTPLTLLSTKLLLPSQRESLSAYAVEEMNLIQVSFHENIAITEKIECAVFTSQNAVKSVFKKNKLPTTVLNTVYCVGERTRGLLESFGVRVEKICYSALELANFLIEKKGISKVYFFCGNLRRDELPDVLAAHNIAVKEIEVYQTELLPVVIETTFDGVLFFSPSAVKSYIAAGNSNESTVFCIGNTTAAEAIMAFEKVYVADTPSVESLITLVKENLN